MSRVIKFRAWDSKTRSWFNFDEPTEDATDADIYMGAGTLLELTPLTERIRIMQFTGLKDKNAVEIYEGDIVSCPVIINQETHGERINRQVIWKNYQWVFDSAFAYLCFEDALAVEDGYRKYDDEGEYTFDIEVIGNIYENPDLLKAA